MSVDPVEVVTGGRASPFLLTCEHVLEYSGRAGLIYCAKRHAVAHGRRAIELEVRQDLAVEPGVRQRVVAAVCALGAQLLDERR